MRVETHKVTVLRQPHSCHLGVSILCNGPVEGELARSKLAWVIQVLESTLLCDLAMRCLCLSPLKQSCEEPGLGTLPQHKQTRLQLISLRKLLFNTLLKIVYNNKLGFKICFLLVNLTSCTHLAVNENGSTYFYPKCTLHWQQILAIQQ